MSNKTKHKITLPEKLRNPYYKESIIDVNGRKINFSCRQTEYYNITDRNFDLLKEGFAKIENIAFSDKQLKSINDFFMENYSRLCELRLFEGFQYTKWVVYKRHDDILFNIYEVWGADMTIDNQKHLFPFVGGCVDVSEQIRFAPENFDFEYQFHLYNEIVDD